MRYQQQIRINLFFAVIAAILVGVGFGLRHATIRYALPYIPYPDETYIMDRILYGFRSGDRLLSDFLRPHLSYNLFSLAVGYDLRVHPVDLNLLPTSTYRITAITSAFIAARTLNVFIGASTAAVVFLWARMLLPLPLAIGAGLVMACLPFHIEFSGLLTPDVAAGLCTVVFFWCATIYYKKPRWYALFGMMLCTGLASGAKYNFVSLVLVSSWLVWQSTPHTTQKWLLLVSSWIGTVTLFVISSPSIMFHFNEFVTGFFNINRYYFNASVNDPVRNQHFPFVLYIGWFAGVLLPVVVAVSWVWGMVCVVRSRHPILLASLVFVTVNVVFFFAQSAHALRNFIFIQPIAVVMSFYGIKKLADDYRWLARMHASWIVGAVVVALSMWSGMQASTFFARPYNQNEVDAYMRTVPPPTLSIGHVEPTLYNQQPWVIPLTTEDVALAHAWQEAGVQTLVINRDYWPDVVFAEADRVEQFPDNEHGGSGSAYDIYQNKAKANLRTIGQPLTGSDGVDILGVRLGRGMLRSQLTPLSAHAELPAAGDALQMNIYFAVTSPPRNTAPLLYVHIIDFHGVQIAARNTPPVDYYPMQSWQAGDLIVANADVPTGALVPGKYQMVIGLYDATSAQNIRFNESSDGAFHLDFTILP